MKKFIIETYGCQMNVSDSELVNAILRDAGYLEAETIETADIIIFNTCSVRKHAEDRVIGRISNDASRKIINPDLKIGVIGCMAQRLGKNLINKRGEVDFIAGVDSYRKLPEMIRSCYSENSVEVDNRVNDQELYSGFAPVRKQDFNAFVTIMRGCDNYCSYCIVPYLRGKERSRRAEEIINEVAQAGREGYKDVTLLGQNVNSYRYGEFGFCDLLRMVNEIEEVSRIRFITSHPKDLSDSLINTMSDCSKVCEHIHLPMQSGSSSILERMNRCYDYQHYQDLIFKLRKKIPNISITTDLIAGFPGETREQFEETLQAMQDIRFDSAFMFKYSSREGTKAADFSESIPESEKLARLDEMINLQTQITTEKYFEQIGRVLEVFVEKTSRRSEKELAGKTRDFKIVVFPGSSDLIGRFVNVKVVDAVGWTLKGELINPE